MTRYAGAAGATLARRSVGLGWRPELAGDLLQAPETIGCAEIVAETCFAQSAARREARAIAEVWPVITHGVKLSLGSAEGVDVERARRLGALARELRSPAISEHVALTRAGGREIGHLTALPYSREAVRVLARNVTRARRALPDVPLLLENIAWSLRWPEDEMDEGQFYAEVVEATGCDLLLDVANLYANAVNAGVAPEALLARYPLERVAMVHIAGGARAGRFYLDTHAHAVPDAVFGLLAELIARIGPVPVILERDGRFPPFAEIAAELARVRSALQDAAEPEPPSRPVAPEPPAPEATSLPGRQALLAELLTEPVPREAGAAFEPEAIARTRAILQHKRVDDALPLLRHLAPYGDRVRAVAFRALRGTPRAKSAAGLADARRIAAAACAEDALAEPARRDRLELRARFTRASRPRLLPFVAWEDLPGGGRVWAIKASGRHAPVRILERKPQRARLAGAMTE